MMVEEIGVDLKISKSQCRELNSGPLPYYVTVIGENECDFIIFALKSS